MPALSSDGSRRGTVPKIRDSAIDGLRRSAQLAGPRVLIVQDGAETASRSHPPQGACEKIVCALKLLAKLQGGGRQLVDTIFVGLQEKCGLKNHE